MLLQDSVSFLDAVEAIARSGAAALMQHWRRLEAHEIDEKARNDFVTAADRASEDAITALVRERFPDHRILAEESGWTGSADDGTAPVWVIDPLDGTTNFVHGFPHFAVSIGVLVEQRPTFGVVLDPVKGDIFRAGPKVGATWNGAPCRISARSSLAGALLSTGFPFRAHPYLDPYLAIFRDVFLGAKAVRRPGAAALDLAYVACGIFDGFFEFQLSPWDMAAGAALVREAGGMITDMDGSDDFLESGDVLCGTPGVCADLLHQVQRHRGLWKAIEDDIES